MPPEPPFGPRAAGPGAPGQSSLRFEVLAKIAQSSTARVDLCRSLGPTLPGQLIAVKRVLPDLVHDEAVGKRFLDEVWMTSALHHPNVVGVVGWGDDESGPYLAVELVEGVSLARLMKSVFETGEQFPERLVVFIGLGVARGLGAAHDLRSDRGEMLGLVHRDLSGANVLASFQGDVKIADFGLAKAKDRLTVTTSELPMRALGHVSPEELMQRAIDHRSDIFSFGVMLYELLTGRTPFLGRDDLDTLEAVLRRPPADPLELRPKLDRSLASLLVRCLEKDPARRPQRAEEVGAELEQWLYAHGYLQDSKEALGRFVRRNSMRQMRWFERVVSGEPEPAPAPFFAPKPSFYKTASVDSGSSAMTSDDATNPGHRAAAMRASSTTEGRATQPTIVEKSTGPAVGENRRPPRRSKSTDSFSPGNQRTRRHDGESPSSTDVTTGRESLPDPETLDPDAAQPTSKRDRFAPVNVPTAYTEEGEDENIPTVAMRVPPDMRASFRERVAQQGPAAPSKAPVTAPPEPGALSPRAAPPIAPPMPPPPMLRRPAETGPQAEVPRPPMPPPSGQGAREGGPARPPPRPSNNGAITSAIERELGRFGAIATHQHERANVAREAARRAAAVAEQAETDVRTVERAIVLARQALELAQRGQDDEAARHLKEALNVIPPNATAGRPLDG